MIPIPKPVPEPAAHVEITRRGFVATGGALFVSLVLLPRSDFGAVEPVPAQTPLNAWIEIRTDGSVLVRTGRAEMGTGMSGFYCQVVAEELSIRPETITLVMGDTDRTPDGGYSAGFLTGAANLRKVAAYTYQALLSLASKRLGTPTADLHVSDGIVSGSGKAVSYSDLMRGQHLDLKIPVTGKTARFAAPGISSVSGLDWTSMDGLVVAGNPPTKPLSEYKVIGSSFPMPVIPDKVTGRTEWSCDVRLPGMLHARMLRPVTLGSTLISLGALDNTRFPTAQICRKGNLVAVLSSDEWEAIRASQAVAATTKWSAWTGLPGSENLTNFLREHKWGAPDGSRGNQDDVATAITNAAHTISASYEQPYVKHAPIGPFVAVADVRSDGHATVWTHSAHSQALRARMANLLSIPVENVVVRWLDHAGQFGRTTFGGDGAEADAVILSQMTGKPVRVQWTLQDDLAWSTSSPAWVSDIEAGVDAQGRIAAIHSQFYSPHMFDARPVGAILAGMPAGTTKPGGFIATEWPYDKIQNRLEQVYAMANTAADSPNGGLRGLIMRTPGQRQQNFVLESLINEAAANANMDPIEFRLLHTTDQRLIEILHATAKAAGWETRPSPHAAARRIGTEPVSGQGVCIMRRAGAYWAGMAKIIVAPEAGITRVTKFTIGVDCGKIVNPRQLERCVKGGVVMGLGEALKEEVTFDNSKVTSTDWSRYKILTMEETPDIEVVQISRDNQGFGAGGEAPNALVPAAVTAAFFDATGVPPHRIPLTAAYVTTLLKSAKGADARRRT